MLQLNLKRTIKKFIDTIDGLDLALVESMNSLPAAIRTTQTQLQEVITSSLELSEQEGHKHYRFHKSEYGILQTFDGVMSSYESFCAARKQLEHLKAAYKTLPGSFFMSLTAAYGDYVAGMAGSLLELRTPLPMPDSSLEINGCLGQKRSGASIQDLSGMHYDGQFEWLKNKFEIDLGTDFVIPGEFAALMERRSCLICNEATVSDRYLEVCKQHGIYVEGINVGDSLEITLEDFSAARDVIYSTGVKLGYVLWRGIIPDQTAKANGALQDIAFGLVQQERYKLARDLLQFANTTAHKYADENNRHVFLINGALAAYLDGDRNACNQMLSLENWRTAPDILKLAYAVLSEQFTDAAGLMRKIGNNSRPSKGEYLRWPLFAKFRNTAEFSSAFEDTFGCITLSEAEIQSAVQTVGNMNSSV